jgi:hypothetical protein
MQGRKKRDITPFDVSVFSDMYGIRKRIKALHRAAKVAGCDSILDT